MTLWRVNKKPFKSLLQRSQSFLLSHSFWLKEKRKRDRSQKDLRTCIVVLDTHISSSCYPVNEMPRAFHSKPLSSCCHSNILETQKAVFYLFTIILLNESKEIPWLFLLKVSSQSLHSGLFPHFISKSSEDMVRTTAKLIQGCLNQ